MEEETTSTDPKEPSETRHVKPVVEEIPPTEGVKSTDPKSDPEASGASMPEMLPVSFPASPAPKGSSLTPWIVALVAFLLVALAGGIYVYVTGTKAPEVLSTPTPIPTPEPLPSATPDASASASPKSEIDLAKYKISILNGSGKIGEANKLKALIEKEGFKVASTANASSFDFEETLVQAKSTVPEEVVDILTDAIAKNYKFEIGDVLKTSNTYDIVITVGSK